MCIAAKSTQKADEWVEAFLLSDTGKVGKLPDFKVLCIYPCKLGATYFAIAIFTAGFGAFATVTLARLYRPHITLRTFKFSSANEYLQSFQLICQES